MPKRPSISILLPVFDAADTLPACLRSIARQTRRDWECVIVDDGSSDAGGALAERAAADDARFRVVATEHRGLVPALNTGIDHCRGDLVARMDADDLMHRERLECQAAALACEPELAGVGSHVRLFPRRTLTAGMRSYERWINGMHARDRIRSDAFVECPVLHPTWMLRREVLHAHRYHERDWPEDYDLLLRLQRAGQELAVVPKRLLAKRCAPERLSQTHAAYSIDRFTACKAFHLALSFLERGEDYVLWGYGGTGRALRRALAHHGKTPAAIVELHPGRIGNRIHGAPVIPPDALADWRGLPLVVSVAGETPRALIRADLAARGWRELSDYVCAA
jgi:cellulose synthase/poly-beta-1,6-N-acetylglucosamine synthase-like glycosyltransferase